ncbi:MAG: alcohol dehydrogenase catalytic domain-containing protein [Coriobacteriia bacterium]|nr:alcohol dehydrogenase catalytic domain-containing protein [Coriobacteriia bacterium]
MRAVVFSDGQVRYVTDQPKPVAQENESLVRIELSAICSTDREILRGYRPDFSGVLGHEFVGIVEQSGTASLVGQRVVGEINLSCGQCLYCQSGRPHHCSERQTLGINNKDGSFADFITLPTELLWPVGTDITSEQAVYTEPLAAALRITEQVSFSDGIPVGIVGDGRLALMICQVLAARTNARITVIGRHTEKLRLFAPFAETALEPDADSTAIESFEVVIDATGNPSALARSISLTRSEGTLVMKSTYAEQALIDISEIVVREITIVGSRCGPFQPSLDLLSSKKVALPELELHHPEDFTAAFGSQAFKSALDFR